MRYGLFVRFLRCMYKTFVPYTVAGNIPDSESPSVYIVHHRNMSGPVHAILTLPEHAHIWSYRVFFDRKECYRQYYDYTFTKRFGMPRFKAAIYAGALSFFVPGVMKSCRGIPVYRDPRRIPETFKISLSALEKGEGLIICPDINYDSSSEQMGEIYTGFLHLEKKYHAATGRHLNFVPVSYNKEEHRTTIGTPVSFDDSLSFNMQKAAVAQKLTQAVNALI